MFVSIIKLALIGLTIPIIVTDAIVNSKIDRIIDLSTQLVKITEKINLEDVSATSQTYQITNDELHRDRLAFIDVKVNGQSLDVIEKSPGSFEVNLAGHDLAKNQLIITSVYTNILKPYPSEISQNERQLVQYQGYQATLSPYLTKTITTRIKLPSSSRLESFSRASKMTTGTNKLTYGPFKDIKPNQPDPLVIHYENNTPFVAVTRLQRIIEVSPWANSINVVNEVKVTHIGAKLKGPFSRFEYQRDQSNGVSSVRSFNVELPKMSYDIYFRDGIGNISTSNVRKTSSKTIVSIRPRFPLFGGWGTDFVLGYSLPLDEFMKVSEAGDQTGLIIPFSDLLYESMFIDEAIVKIFLPAGSNNIVIENQLGAERLKDELSYKYLDVIGRPVLVLKKKNVVGHHLDKPIVVRFDYSKLYMSQEPILLIGASIMAFILAAVYSRMSGHCNTKTKLE